MEIKQGDKVRVSKDAPRMYVSGLDHIYLGVDSTVIEIEDRNAVIKLNSGNTNVLSREIAIPTKYLVKVGGEYKPKFKKGDKVRFKKVYTVVSVDDGQVFIDSAGNHIDEDCLELYTEPTEQTEAEEDARIRQMEAELDEFRKAELERILHPEKPIFEVTVDNMAMNWQRYEADLAKEVAVMLVRTHRNDLNKVAKMSVDIAKAVVEGLKRK